MGFFYFYSLIFMATYKPVTASQQDKQSWRRYSNYQFAAEATLLPVLLNELPKLLPNYVLTFAAVADEGLGLMVLTGLLPAQNAYLNGRSQWIIPYVPAVLRSHPFKLGTLPESKATKVLMVDETSDLLVPQGEGEAFFESDGQASAALKQVMEFLSALDVQHTVTQRAVDALKHAGVLEAWPVQLALPDSTAGAAAGAKATKQLVGLWRVSEKALNALAPDALATLRDQGALAVAYAQLFSMAQMDSLVALVQRLAQPSPPKAASVNGLPAAAAFQLPQSDTLKFS